MIDLGTETPLSLAAATRLIPPGRNGKATALSTLLRWILRGAKASDGQTVRLEAIRLGGRWMTSTAALQRFAERLTPQLDPTPAVVRSPAARGRASERAGRELDREWKRVGTR
jgi:hypothetical protein